RDAHFIMSTYLGIYNMRERCVTLFLNWMWGRPLQDFTERERFWLVVYGLCVPLYYTCHGIIIFYPFGAQLMYYLAPGAGVISFRVVMAYAFYVPLAELLPRPVRWLLASEAGSIKRWLVRVGWVVLAIVILLIPYPYDTGGPFQILPSVQTEVHCEID